VLPTYGVEDVEAEKDHADEIDLEEI